MRGLMPNQPYSSVAFGGGGGSTAQSLLVGGAPGWAILRPQSPIRRPKSRQMTSVIAAGTASQARNTALTIATVPRTTIASCDVSHEAFHAFCAQFTLPPCAIAGSGLNCTVIDAKSVRLFRT